MSRLLPHGHPVRHGVTIASLRQFGFQVYVSHHREYVEDILQPKGVGVWNKGVLLIGVDRMKRSVKRLACMRHWLG